MQFGIFSVSDITRDPVTNDTPSEAERIDAIVKIAQKTEEVGMDVFAIGEHHNPPFFSSSPTTLPGSSPAGIVSRCRKRVHSSRRQRAPGILVRSRC